MGPEVWLSIFLASFFNVAICFLIFSRKIRYAKSRYRQKLEDEKQKLNASANINQNNKLRQDLLELETEKVFIQSELMISDAKIRTLEKRLQNADFLQTELLKDIKDLQQDNSRIRDERSELAARIDAGLEADVLLLSGGVSAGVLDLVPSELQRAGVEQIFHTVNVKPGKPLWFGVLRQGDRSKLVFGLPGNPVSSMVTFELFVRPALRRLMGVDPAEPQTVSARLAHSHSHRGDRPTYFPASISLPGDGLSVSLANWHGSSDLQSTVGTNGMVVFPPEPVEYAAGDTVEVIRWSGELS